MSGKTAFFSVKHGVQIDGAPYRPAICYPVRGLAMERAVAELIAAGAARGYAEEVRFINGVPYPVKKPPATAQAKAQGKKLGVSSSASRKGK
jgi:endonuclease YncB( thermonuclease family)